jgi:DNA-binding transcriptional regulator YdaS (Cro superfamily)
MKLDTYLEQRGAGAHIARALGVNQVMVSQWRYGIKQVPAERCPAIEKATAGAVRCEDLRPDVDWAYLRATNCSPENLGAGDTVPAVKEAA